MSQVSVKDSVPATVCKMLQDSIYVIHWKSRSRGMWFCERLWLSSKILSRVNPSRHGLEGYLFVEERGSRTIRFGHLQGR